MAGRGAGEHGSRIILALEAAWGAIRDRHRDVPAVVLITGSGSRQRGTPEGYRLHGHHWPERWITGAEGEQRAPELFIAGELLSGGGRAVLEVMLHEGAHALAVARHIRDTSAEGNRYHNRRFTGLAAEMGLQAPERPVKVIGWSNCAITDETTRMYAGVIETIDQARLPFLLEHATPSACSARQKGLAAGQGSRRGGRRARPCARARRRGGSS